MKADKHRKRNTDGYWRLMWLTVILPIAILRLEPLPSAPGVPDKDELQTPSPSLVPYSEPYAGEAAKRRMEKLYNFLGKHGTPVSARVTPDYAEEGAVSAASVVSITSFAEEPTIAEEEVAKTTEPLLIDSEEEFIACVGEVGLTGEYRLTWGEYDHLARTVAGECGGIYAEPYKGHVAVAQCIKDRLVSDVWPNSIEGVLVPGQFATPYRGSMELYSNCYQAVWEVFMLGDSAFDEPVIYFMNPNTSGHNAAAWIRSHHYVGTIGSHEFYS